MFSQPDDFLTDGHVEVAELFAASHEVAKGSQACAYHRAPRPSPWLPLAGLEHLASSVDHRRRTKLDPQRRLGAMASPRPQPSAARPARGQPRPWVPPPGLAPGRGAAF